MLATLDVLDYLAALEREFARPVDGRAMLSAPLRRSALRDVRRTLDAMAFRYALMDERPLPEDLDYIRALEALKTPDKAAPALARRAPTYARARRRRLVTSWSIVGALVLVVAGLVYAATYEGATTLAEVNERGLAGDAVERTFVVDANITRLHLDGTIVVNKEEGPISISLIGPDNREYLGEVDIGAEFYSNGGNYLRKNVYDPADGLWTLRVIYGGGGSVLVTVDGIQPR